MVKRIIFLLVLFASITVCFAIEVGDNYLSISLTDLDRQRYRTKDIFDGSWIVLDFFATDCEPCKKELPEINDLIRELKKAGNIEIKGYILATDAGSTSVLKEYFRNFDTDLIVLHDRYKMMAKRYGIEKLPSLFLVNPQGKIVFIQIGYSEKLVKNLKRIIVK